MRASQALEVGSIPIARSKNENIFEHKKTLGSMFVRSFLFALLLFFNNILNWEKFSHSRINFRNIWNPRPLIVFISGQHYCCRRFAAHTTQNICQVCRVKNFCTCFHSIAENIGNGRKFRNCSEFRFTNLLLLI